MFDLNNLIRENIKILKSYSSARNEYKGNGGIFLDANENSFGSPVGRVNGIGNLNRYPDPLQPDLKRRLGKLKSVSVENIFLGNGSDEAIDILFRAFCRPGIDNVVVCPPTYGMYEVSASINDVDVISVSLLQETFQLDVDRIRKSMNDRTKLLFICSPNNPTGNTIKKDSVEMLLNSFAGIVVLDEAYIDFAKDKSFLDDLERYPNLVILQTLSKAWGLAGLRVGMAFASKPIIEIFNRIKAPYNLNVASQSLVLKALENENQVRIWIKEIISERNLLSGELLQFSFVKGVYDSETNFLLVKVENAMLLYGFLIQKSIIVRNRSTVFLCEDCIRITVGKKEENGELINMLKQFKNEKGIIY